MKGGRERERRRTRVSVNKYMGATGKMTMRMIVLGSGDTM
jgi:hypothetical protein